MFQDRGNPDAIQKTYNDVPFDAHFASSTQQYLTVSEMPGVDGFTMQVDPLYKVRLVWSDLKRKLWN